MRVYVVEYTMACQKVCSCRRSSPTTATTTPNAKCQPKANVDAYVPQHPNVFNALFIDYIHYSRT